jgi:mutator protein MutT
MVIADHHILVEQRSATKRLLPGVLAIPGGHVEPGESIEDALVRELREELGIVPQGFSDVCVLLHRAEEYRRLHYFAIEKWTGEIHRQEADQVRWLPVDDLSALELDIDVLAIESYLAKR